VLGTPLRKADHPSSVTSQSEWSASAMVVFSSYFRKRDRFRVIRASELIYYFYSYIKKNIHKELRIHPALCALDAPPITSESWGPEWAIES
jgi:hypothetical protein